MIKTKVWREESAHRAVRIPHEGCQIRLGRKKWIEITGIEPPGYTGSEHRQFIHLKELETGVKPRECNYWSEKPGTDTSPYETEDQK